MTRGQKLALGIFVCASVLMGLAQSKQSFRWNWRRAQYLTLDDRLDRYTALTARDRTLLLSALAERSESEEELHQDAAQTIVREVRLGTLPGKFFVVQAVDTCSPTGNCEFWVVREEKHTFKIVLHRQSVQRFTIQPELIHGLHDLVLGMHGSATEQGLFHYRFDGTRYQFAGCYDANWTYLDKNGEVQELKEPSITPCRVRRK